MGELMGQFFSNVARYPKYLISIIVGGLVALLEPLFKNRSNPLTIVGLISSLLKKEITLILQNDLENDLIRDHFVNISKIDLSGDLQHCKIYITSTAEEKVRKEIVENLNTAKSSIR